LISHSKELPLPQRILLFALNNWLGAARLPAALHRAGFEVVVLCPGGSFMSMTRFVNRRLEMRGRVEANAISKTIWQEVAEQGTTAIVPVDTRAVEFMHAFAAAVQQGTFAQTPGVDKFQAALERSLPPVEHLEAAREGAAGHAAAVELGIPALPQARVTSVDEAITFAGEHGYPLVLKSGGGGAGGAAALATPAGEEIAICTDEAELRAAHEKLTMPLSHPPPPPKPLVIEVFVDGPQLSHVFVARGGRILAGLTRLKVKSYPNPHGPSSVVRVVDVPKVADHAARFAERVRYNGFGSLQCVVDPASKSPQFVEFNCRPVPMHHLGEEAVGIDWCKAWHAELDGQSPPTFAGPIFKRQVALFPQEWMRDPQSKYLTTNALHDVPWDDPGLLKGYVELRK
jgi:predicted ATP-grasp superfamily ATP-dependent carboligase